MVTADHGAAFEVGEPLRGVSTANADNVLWVPLLVKAPGQATGQIDDRPARTIDVLPTMAEILDLDLPDGVDGVSLLGPEPSPAPTSAGSMTGASTASNPTPTATASSTARPASPTSWPSPPRARATTPTCASTAGGAGANARRPNGR